MKMHTVYNLILQEKLADGVIRDCGVIAQYDNLTQALNAKSRRECDTDYYLYQVRESYQAHSFNK